MSSKEKEMRKTCVSENCWAAQVCTQHRTNASGEAEWKTSYLTIYLTTDWAFLTNDWSVFVVPCPLFHLAIKWPSEKNGQRGKGKKDNWNEMCVRVCGYTCRKPCYVHRTSSAVDVDILDADGNIHPMFNPMATSTSRAPKPIAAPTGAPRNRRLWATVAECLSLPHFVSLGGPLLSPKMV